MSLLVRDPREKHEINRGLSIDFALPTVWTTPLTTTHQSCAAKCAIHNHPAKSTPCRRVAALTRDSKVELTWAVG